MSPSPDATVPDTSDTTGSSAEQIASPSTGRTLFARPGTEDKHAAPSAKAQVRRQRLHTHAQRAAARREALLAILQSSALVDMVRIDPGLNRDVAKLMAFVLDDVAPQR